MGVRICQQVVFSNDRRRGGPAECLLEWDVGPLLALTSSRAPLVNEP